MEIAEERTGDVLVLSPDGNLSTGEDCQALEQKLSRSLAGGARFVVVDCGRVGHLRGEAIRALLLAARKLGRVKGRLVLCGMTPKVQKSFSLSGFDRDFTVLPTREEAIRTVLQPASSSTGSGARGSKKAHQAPPAEPATPPETPAPVSEAAPTPVATKPAAAPVAAAAPPSAEPAPRSPESAPAWPPPTSPDAAAAPAASVALTTTAQRLLAAFGDTSAPAVAAPALPAARVATLEGLAAHVLRALEQSKP